MNRPNHIWALFEILYCYPRIITEWYGFPQDKRNFLRNPPTGVQFHFDYETCYPVAMATLAEDDKLQKMRFELVPKM